MPPEADPGPKRERGDSDQQRRQNTMVFSLATMAAILFAGAMIFLTGGFFFYVVAGLAGIVLLGTFHYVTWGRALEEEVAGEREELEMLDRVREETAPRPRSTNIRR
jgi:hypothetical protein